MKGQDIICLLYTSGVNVLKKKTKCYIYTRVSTAIQVDGDSLDAQKDKIRKSDEIIVSLEKLSTLETVVPLTQKTYQQ